jgi:flagellar export protein FliJ
MKSFIFRLERVFRLRAQTERQRAQELALAIRDEQARRDALERAAARLDRCSEQIAGTEGSIAAAGTLRNLGITVAAAANQMELAEVSHRDALDTVASEEQQFGLARMERRVVERLREQRRTAWGVEQSRDEQREIDGLAAHRRNPGSAQP